MNSEAITAKRERVWPILAFIAIVVLLGVNFVAVKFSNQELAPFWGAALRFFVAAGILFGIVKVKNLPLPIGRTLLAAVLYGLLLFGVTYGLLYWALLTVSSGMASVIFTTIPLTTLLIAAAIGIEKLTWRGVIGAVIVLGGIALIFIEQLQFNVPFTSLLLVFLAVISGSASGVVIKVFPQGNPITMNAIGMAAGATALLAISVIVGEPFVLPSLNSTWLALAWLVTSSIGAFVLFVWLIARWTASAVSYTAVLPPIVTVIVASVLIGETVAANFLVGAALVLLGVYVGVLSPTSSKKPANV